MHKFAAMSSQTGHPDTRTRKHDTEDMHSSAPTVWQRHQVRRSAGSPGTTLPPPDIAPGDQADAAPGGQAGHRPSRAPCPHTHGRTHHPTTVEHCPPPRTARAHAHARAGPGAPGGGPPWGVSHSHSRTFGPKFFLALGETVVERFCWFSTGGCGFGWGCAGGFWAYSPGTAGIELSRCEVTPAFAVAQLGCASHFRARASLSLPGQTGPLPPQVDLEGSTRQIRRHYQKALSMQHTSHLPHRQGPDRSSWATSVVLGSQDVSPVIPGWGAATDSVTTRSSDCQLALRNPMCADSQLDAGVDVSKDTPEVVELSSIFSEK